MRHTFVFGLCTKKPKNFFKNLGFFAALVKTRQWMEMLHEMYKLLTQSQINAARRTTRKLQWSN